MVDPIADMLTRIRNAYLARRSRVEIPHSKVKEAIARILVREGYLVKVDVVSQAKKQQPVIIGQLRYEGKVPALDGVERISKPGRRMFGRSKKIPQTVGGIGSTIVSTPQGIMTAKEARQRNLGGEILFRVW